MKKLIAILAALVAISVSTRGQCAQSNDPTNLFKGTEAGLYSTLGDGEMGRYQTFLGAYSGRGSAAYLSFRNTGIGPFTLSSIESGGGQNVAIAPFAGMRITTGSKNFFGGVESGSHCTTCANNTAIATSTMRFATTALGNVVIGNDAMYHGNGDSNVIVGGINFHHGLGSWTSSVGYAGFYNLINGNGNSGLGWLHGFEWQDGSNNLFLGQQTGRFATTGNGNVLIGDQVYGIDGNNQLNISNLIFSDNANGKGFTISSGGIGIGTRTPEGRLDVNGNATIRGDLKVCDALGCVTVTAAMLRTLLGQ